MKTIVQQVREKIKEKFIDTVSGYILVAITAVVTFLFTISIQAVLFYSNLDDQLLKIKAEQSQVREDLITTTNARIESELQIEGKVDKIDSKLDLLLITLTTNKNSTTQ